MGGYYVTDLSWPNWIIYNYIYTEMLQVVFTARCALVQSAVLRSHVVCLSVCL